MRKAVVEPLAPMRCRIGVAESGPHPDFAVTHLGGAGRHVLFPQIKGTATRLIQAGVGAMVGVGGVLLVVAVPLEALKWGHLLTALKRMFFLVLELLLVA